MATTQQPALQFTGHKRLIERLVISTLTGRRIRISKIRPESHASPGLAPHEVSFLRLLEALTNGSHIEFSYTGTTVLYKPGLITGSAAGHGAVTSGDVLRHELPKECSRSVSYFLIPICLLAPFSKAPFNITFSGEGCITSATPAGDVSVDTVRTAILPLYAHFGISKNIELRILRRSNPGPGGHGGGGEVQLVFGHQVRLPNTIHMMQPGRIKRIRGVAYATGVAGANNARMIEGARGVLNEFCPDTYVFSDVSAAPHVKNKDPNAPRRKTGVGFGISLVADSTTDCLFSADMASSPAGGSVAEDVGRECALQLLETVAQAGCVSMVAAPTVMILMAMGSEDVGRVTVGKDVLATEVMIGLARDLKSFGCPAWGLRDAEDTGNGGEVIVSVVGKGFGNVGRKVA